MGHSCRVRELLFFGDALHCRGHFRGVVQVREFVWPGAVGQQMVLHVPDQLLEAFALVIPGALVMDIPKGPFNRVRLRAVGRQEQQLEAGMRGKPPLDRLGLVNAIIVHDHRDFVEPRFGVPPLQTVQ